MLVLVTYIMILWHSVHAESDNRYDDDEKGEHADNACYYGGFGIFKENPEFSLPVVFREITFVAKPRVVRLVSFPYLHLPHDFLGNSIEVETWCLW